MAVGTTIIYISPLADQNDCLAWFDFPAPSASVILGPDTNVIDDRTSKMKCVNIFQSARANGGAQESEQRKTTVWRAGEPLFSHYPMALGFWYHSITMAFQKYLDISCRYSRYLSITTFKRFQAISSKMLP